MHSFSLHRIDKLDSTRLSFFHQTERREKLNNDDRHLQRRTQFFLGLGRSTANAFKKKSKRVQGLQSYYYITN